MTKRRPIMDETGKARQWLDSGHGIAIWESHEIGANRPDILTPGDAPKPHWAYVKAETITSLDACLFYSPMNVVKSWSDTPAGLKAAQRALDKMPDTEHDAPIGKVYTAYTIYRYTLGSICIRPDSEGGTVLDRFGDNHLTAVEFRVGIRQWSAIDKAESQP